ncbi:SCO family protein [Gracilimonas mengyeensis]|uniref:Protein SCO1/2 n=1 Tax=Gracilimonas mengyeensis TaxID=1302730 RepID=A0A521BAH6_9BACT|nr:SCO family protein [Gracilimonas mengyeensis]SMO44088.1 protein SCO1/2 [Gracilimonas mengyeensis]
MRRFALLAVVGLTVLLTSQAAQAQLNREQPDALQELGIDENLGETIPLDAVFATSEGDSVRLGDLLEEGKPVLLNPLYYDCPMLCGLVIDGVINVVNDLSWKPGKDFVVISFSIDPQEDATLARTSKQNYLKNLTESERDSWHFLTGKKSQIDKVVQSVGFQYKEIQETGEYAHSAAIMLLSPEGKITRYLYGISYDEFNVRNALYEAADGNIGSTIDKVVMYCYQYDPESGSYAPVAINIMKLGGLATLIILGIFLGMLWLREKRRKSNLNN